MERTEMLKLWNDMWKDGNWVPAWPDSLTGLNAEAAAWSPDSKCHSIWQEVVHVIFWRNVTLRRMAGGSAPDEEEIARQEFAMPETASQEVWSATVAELQRTQVDLAAAIQNEASDVS